MAEIKVWDIFIRFFHWTIVASFFIAYVTEDGVMWLHEIAGYIILALIVARIIWGIVGTRYARFTNFVYKPETIKQYFKDSLRFKSKRYIGHNPLGGAMVILLLVMLVLTSWSGIEAEGGSIFAENTINIEVIKSAVAEFAARVTAAPRAATATARAAAEAATTAHAPIIKYHSASCGGWKEYHRLIGCKTCVACTPQARTTVHKTNCGESFHVDKKCY